MAIITFIPGLEVTIAVEGQALQEYDNPEHARPEFPAMTPDLFDLPDGHSKLGKAEASDLPTEVIQQQKELAKDYGTIRVEFFRMTTCGIEPSRSCGISSAPSRPSPTPFSAPDPMEEVSEKAFKKGRAVDCVTKMVEVDLPSKRPLPRLKVAPKPRRAPKPKQIRKPIEAPKLKGTFTDPRKRPFAVFEFRYRSKEGLMREAVIPRPTRVDQLQDLSSEELRKRLAQMMEVNERLAEQATRRNATDAMATVRGKRPAEDDGEIMAKYKARRLNNGRLEIDLTDD
ncbi:hypothetical protein VTJ49DRAFT_2546 [Mycothermus thermophilus]|uniref:DUF7918 domain-containing protein n=1 Tax=Humicola insolens TaxID=85995 RepID=A0ABR3VBK3_HUMIN